jgi:transcriptional regulator with XRE-family HTH domain
MNDTQPGTPGTERTPFSSWLDSIIPAVFKNDAEFARRLGVNQSYVHRWRRGVQPQVPALMKIARLTGTDIETLLRIAGYQDEES